jgi:hypothetical protein
MTNFKFTKTERQRMRLNKKGQAAMDCIEEIVNRDGECSPGAQRFCEGLLVIVEYEINRRRRLEIG